jgi:peptide-methionine (S)-S-oxide reductase
MRNDDIKDDLFLSAVNAIDAGDLTALKTLVQANPRLLTMPLDYPKEGYFKNPYLIFFIADNPIRIPVLPPSIVDITVFLVQALKNSAAGNIQWQLDYTMGLVATGLIPRVSGVQIDLIDLLWKEGANLASPVSALAEHNVEAAKRLIELGAPAPLAAVMQLRLRALKQNELKDATSDEKQIALMVAAFYGNVENVALLLEGYVNPNGYISRESEFHSHASPLHQAVSSGSLKTVRLLVEHDGDLAAKDLIYDGTPYGWAQHISEAEETAEADRGKYMEIENYLREIIDSRR